MKDKILKTTFVQMIGVILARCVIMTYNPLGIGYFAALYSKPEARMITFLLMAFSMFTSQSVLASVKYIMVMMTIVFLLRITEAAGKRMGVYSLGVYTFGIMLIFELLGIVMEGGITPLPQKIIAAVTVSCLGASTSVIFSKGIDGIYKGKLHKMQMEEILGVAILMAVTLYYVGSTNVMPESVLKGLLYLAIMFAGNRYGAGYGAVVGNICGVIACMWTGSLAYIGNMGILGTISGVFRKFGRLINSVVFIISAILLEYIFMGTLGPESTVQGICMGIAAFIILPCSVTGAEDDEDGRGRESMIRREGEKRLKLIAESFEKLSESFSMVQRKKQLSEHDLEVIGNEMIAKMCGECSKCRLCAVQPEIQAEMRLLVEKADAKGKLTLQDMSSRFMMNCLSPEIFISELNHTFEKARMNMVWGNKLIESREVISLQLKQIAGMMGEYGKMLYSSKNFADGKEEQLRRSLKRERINLKKFMILENRNHQKEYMITAKCQKGKVINVRDLGKLVGDIVEMELEPAINGRKILGNEYATISFVEKKNFYALHGMARKTKKESDVSGDNFTFSEIGNGQLLMSIADGMGSGYYAFQDSETAIELLEQLMDSGFSEDVALKMINSVMLVNSDSEKPTTLDMGIINLASGVCDFVKLGAASTFVKREGWVEAIKSTTMPMGVFEQVDIESTSKKMYSGDMIIMVSDGIVEAISADDKEKAMSEIIMGINSTNPKEMAASILENVLEYNSSEPEDDMTVLVAGIWNRAA